MGYPAEDGADPVDEFEPDATEVGLSRPEDENPNYGPGNPDWEYDRGRDDDIDAPTTDFGRGVDIDPAYDPRIDYPERYTDGPI